ncbi:MAG TPA: NYN domain-containing protein [Mycobacteriales bacterium]|nr:NYN domain-containing protein [Mycobacteriales bacterium]
MTADDGAVLPEPVRQRVVALAAETLGTLGHDEVPSTLRAAARFTPSKRARLAAGALAAALERDQLFRLRTLELAEARGPALVEAIRDGELPAAADPVELAAVAYLLRLDGWQGYVRRAAEALREGADRARTRERDEAVTRLRAQVEEARAALAADAERFTGQLTQARAELDTLRRRLRAQTGELRAAQRARTEAAEALAEERRRAAAADSAGQAEIRRLRQRLAEAEDGLEAARRSARESRSADETRLWLLLDTASGAVQGLRRELALSPTEDRPADAVAAALPGERTTAGPPDDVLLDRLLGLPRVHLVIDGYNVTKTGYGGLPLATQRDRLVQSLGALAARTRAEVTCVFDGADRPPVMPGTPRGVRVLFSRTGETADDLIRRLVAAEPAGRPVVVVSSDREVADGVRRSGAYPIAAVALLRLLDRG